MSVTQPRPDFAAPATTALDLTACAREPIRTPGSIQPHGILLVVDPARRNVVQAAVPPGLLDGEAGDLLDQPLADVLGGALRDVAARLDDIPASGTAHLGLVSPGDGEYHALAHRADGMVVLELERVSAGEAGTLEDLYPLIRTFIGHLERSPELGDLCELAAREVRQLTGMDRVLIYRFDADWNGTVIAESGNDRLPSYMDLRFPASDIPAQARDLYRLNRLRLIADAQYHPVPIQPTPNPLTGRPIDLGQAVLRSVSPVHLQYMRNMGTAASMSISLLREGRLWGLISCHHHAPLVVPYHVRTACDLLGQVLSLQITSKEHSAEAEQRIARRAIHSRLLGLMAGEEDFLSGLVREPARLLELTGATGAALVHQGRTLLLGRTPAEEEVAAIVDWLVRSATGDEFHTDSLATVFPPAAAFKDRASGLLAVPVSQMHASYVLWFRPEVVQTVSWGGDPRKARQTEPLTPRTSFQAWKETVRMRSLPWQRIDLDAALELRTAIVDIVLRKAEEMADLNEQLVRSNKELEAFSYSVSHDLRAPFRHIVGYSELLLQTAADKLDARQKHYIATIIESANGAGTLVDNLLSFSQMGRSTLGKIELDMGAVAEEARQKLEMEVGDREILWRIGKLPTVRADPMMLRLVLQNLFANAIKFTRGREPAVIEFECHTEGDEHVFRVRDNGCGFDMRYVNKLFGVFQRLHHTDEFEGTGIGLANVRRIIERHEGRTWAEGALGRGATLYFTLPVSKGPPS